MQLCTVIIPAELDREPLEKWLNSQWGGFTRQWGVGCWKGQVEDVSIYWIATPSPINPERFAEVLGDMFPNEKAFYIQNGNDVSIVDNPWLHEVA